MATPATQRSQSAKGSAAESMDAPKSRRASELKAKIAKAKRARPNSKESVLLVEVRKLTKGSPLQTHDLVTKGIGVSALRRLMRAYQLLDTSQVLKVIGTSERTLQRAAEKARPLDTNVSDRAVRLATVTSQAIAVLGSEEAAERWLGRPAPGLDGRKPISLLQSTEGTEMVKTLLTRMDYDVYT